MPNECSIDWCDRIAVRKGYCNAHYVRLRRGKNMDNPIWMPGLPRATCSIENCDRPVRAKKLCSTHYERQLDGNEDSDIKHIKPKGSGHTDSLGYRYIYIDGVQVAEHRYLMAQNLGRQLLPGETVHHKNGNRSDNDLNNLELWSSAQPYGQRVKDKVKWAKEIINLYDSDEITNEIVQRYNKVI